MVNFYISDTHFDHYNIIRLASRPFTSVDEMNEAMVANWNKAVSKADTVYFLGDFAWNRPKYFFDQLNGNKHLIRGNHDQNSMDLGWTSVQDYLELQDGKRRVVLFHYPIIEWNGQFRGAYHLYGHVHNKKLDIAAKAFDVGAEAMGYTPRTLEQIIGAVVDTEPKLKYSRIGLNNV
jgi:calcineurin-like phosphoesterase family protein